jgi:hypothetical protein
VTTALLPFTPVRAKRSTMMKRWLLGGCGGAWVYLEKRDLREVWAEHEQAVVGHHVKRRPGTRPSRWWEYSAPEPRRRLGGTGSALAECSGYIAPFENGIPSAWRLHGDFTGTRDLDRWPPIDPDDPPRFESEAKYLLRLGLLLPGERERLCPRDFWPELVEP